MERLVITIALQKRQRRNWITRSVLTIALLAGASGSANADSILATNAAGEVYYSLIDANVGYRFDVLDQDVQVTRLGFFDYLDDGLTYSHEIGIWATTGGAPLATATIAAGTGAALEAGFRWMNLLAPLNLTARTDYVLGATVVGGDDIFDIFPSEADIDLGFSVSTPSALVTFGPGLNQPTFLAGEQGFFAPNLAAVAIPDGGLTALFLGASLFALLLIRG